MSVETVSETRVRLRQGVDTPLKALSIQEAAATAGIAVSTLYARIQQGAGPRVTKIGFRTVILLVDLEEWLLALRAG